MSLLRWITERGVALKPVWPGVRDPSDPNLAQAPAARSRNVVVVLPYEEAFDACISAVNSVRGVGVVGVDREVGSIFARGKMNAWTFGSAISVTLQRHSETADANETQVTVTCAPEIRNTISDWGESSRKVNEIARHLTQAAPAGVLLRSSRSPAQQANLLQPSGLGEDTQPAQLLRAASAETTKPSTEATECSRDRF